MTVILPSGIWRHYKGGFYQLLGVAEHSESGELLVVYVSLDASLPGPRMRARPLSMWNEQVAWGGGFVPRFSHVGHQVRGEDE